MNFLKYIILKSIKILAIIIVISIVYAAYETWFVEPDNPKTTWYWADDCLENRINYRTFDEGGITVVEISNDMVGDAMITFEIYDGVNREEYIKTLKSGSTTGKIHLSNKTDYPTIKIISVVMLKNGEPDYILECTK